MQEEVCVCEEQEGQFLSRRICRHVGYQDDQYFYCDVGTFQHYEECLLRALHRGGHEL